MTIANLLPITPTALLIASSTVLLLILGKKFFNGGSCSITKDLTGKVVIVTGANTGIGKETARALAHLKATVILACRDAKRTEPLVLELQKETQNKNIEFIPLDLADLQSVKAFTEKFKSKYRRLDILVNNAGVMAPLQRRTTKDGFELQFGTNHLGHFYLTCLLLDLIKASGPSRIINVASKAQVHGKMNWEDLMYEKNYSPFATYAQSKLANVIFSKELQRRFDAEKANVKAVSVHPGAVRTELSRYLQENILLKIVYYVSLPVYYFMVKSAKQGAQTSLYCALEDQDKLKGGEYFADCKVTKVNPDGFREDYGEKLWKVSEELINKKTQ